MSLMLGVVSPTASPWAFHAHPDTWFVIVFFAYLYWYAMKRLGPRVVATGARIVTRRQVMCFYAGLLALEVAGDWPLHDLAENYLYSAHMVQHMLISLVAPPLLLLGCPAWLVRWILRSKWAAGTVRILARPLVAGIMFNAVIAISHAPFWVDGTLYHHAVHFWAHLLLFVVAMFMWFPVVNRLEEFPSLYGMNRLLYLFLQSVLPNLPAAFLLLSTSVVYKFYATVPHPFMSAINDQQLAGAIMKVGGTFYLWSIITVMFFRWVAFEHRSGNAVADRAASAQAAQAGIDRRSRVAEPEVALPAPAPALVARASDAVPRVLTWEDVAEEFARTPPAEPDV
ncbi:MAG TPA: cytochrome c oxidase assembly protein [Acidimicrobiales bacterium]|jgi:putative membrane protein|nr:cytochrome c oxidase assembly protein [Acidimicrobiales bacterium]